jgi:AcrR family transcriptional regulator
MPSDTRQRLIESAKRRFYRDGFRNVGIDAVLDDVGISKAAFYKHFESRDALIVAVLHDLDLFFRQQLREMLRARGGPSAAGQLRGLMDVFQQVIDEAEDFHGCIFVSAAMEFPLPHDPAHEAAAGHKRALEGIVYELAERARADDPAAVAQELCMIIEGAFVTRTVTNDPGTIAIARRLADRVIAQHLPPA